MEYRHPNLTTRVKLGGGGQWGCHYISQDSKHHTMIGVKMAEKFLEVGVWCGNGVAD